LVVVDVGGVYDPSKHRYDHHQREFTGTFSSETPEIKLSSAGLVYKHFGKEIIKDILNTDDEQTNLLYKKVYGAFIKELDAIDNGVDVIPAGSDLKPVYSIGTGLSARVGHLNPHWYDENPPSQDEQFKKAMALTGSEFVESVEYFGKSWLKARDVVKASIDARFKCHPSGEIVIMNSYAPWQDHLMTIEEEEKINPLIKFVLYTDSGANWRVHSVAKAKGSYALRKGLLKAWRGVRDEVLSEASGIPGCVFVHASGFIGGNKTYEGALEMAVRSIAAPDE